MTNVTDIAERFREVRKKSGLKQVDFAASIGVTHSVISDIERGAREPSRQVMAAIAQVYNVDLNWLLLGIGKSEKKSQDQTFMNDLEKCEREIEELKKSIAILEKENKELSKELLDRMRQLLDFKDKFGHSHA